MPEFIDTGIMDKFTLEEPPSQIYVMATLLGCFFVSAFQLPLLEVLSALIPLDETKFSSAEVIYYRDLFASLIFLVEAVLLCVITHDACGFGLGDFRNWQRKWYAALFIWIMPPLMTLSVYKTFTNTPFYGKGIAFWLISSLAQQLMFSGFIYGRMSVIFGKPSYGGSGAFAPALLVTALLFSLFHWPNLRINEEGPLGFHTSYAVFQMIYSLLGAAWLLNIRRWTGTIWPIVLCHVLSSFLATMIRFN